MGVGNGSVRPVAWSVAGFELLAAALVAPLLAFCGKYNCPFASLASEKLTNPGGSELPPDFPAMAPATSGSGVLTALSSSSSQERMDPNAPMSSSLP